MGFPLKTKNSKKNTTNFAENGNIIFVFTCEIKTVQMHRRDSHSTTLQHVKPQGRSFLSWFVLRRRLACTTLKQVAEREIIEFGRNCVG
jgi:hypothetical protein